MFEINYADDCLAHISQKHPILLQNKPAESNRKLKNFVIPKFINEKQNIKLYSVEFNSFSIRLFKNDLLC